MQPESDIGKDRGDAGSTLEFAVDPFEPNGGSKADAMRPGRVEVSEVLDALVIARPKPNARRPEHLCADAGFTGQAANQVIRQRRYMPHVCKR